MELCTNGKEILMFHFLSLVFNEKESQLLLLHLKSRATESYVSNSATAADLSPLHISPPSEA